MIRSELQRCAQDPGIESERETAAQEAPKKRGVEALGASEAGKKEKRKKEKKEKSLALSGSWS